MSDRPCIETGCDEPCIDEHQRCREHAAQDWDRYPPAGPVYADRIRRGEDPFTPRWEPVTVTRGGVEPFSRAEGGEE